MALAVGKIDEIVREYLLYRGLTATSKQLDTELKNEKEKKFRVDKIMDALHSHINNYDLASLRDQWHFLEQRLFSRLEQVYTPSVRKLETSLLKLYVVNAVQNNKNDKMMEFFEKMTSELQGQAEWREWFMLPFIKNPEENRVYAMYFTRQWQDTLFLTLHNFLSVIIRSLPLPPAFEFEEEARKLSKLQDENAKLRQLLNDFKQQKIALSSAMSEDSLVSTPVGPPPAPNSLDLMDDFSVLSQETRSIPKASTTPQQAHPNQIKSFFKNITNSSPIMGRKTTQPQAGRNQYEGPSMPQTAGATGQSKGNGAGNSTKGPAPSNAPTKKDEKQKAKIVDGQSKAKSKTGFVVPGPQASAVTAPGKADGKDGILVDISAPDDASAQPGGGDLTPVCPEIADDESPLLLLSQEEYGEHRSCITHCRFNSTGQKVATADVDGVVKVWGLQPSPVTEATTMSKSAILSLDWIRSEKLLLGSKGGLVRLFDVKEKKTIKEAAMEVSYPRVVSLTCNPQGTHFVCSSVGRSRPPGGANVSDVSTLKIGRLAIWDLRTMKIERGLPVVPNSIAVNWATYNHNGQMVITGASDGHIRLFDTRKGDCLSSWTAHTGDVYSVVFSPDETTCYSMGADGKFVHWSVHKTGHLLSSLPIHQGACGPFVHTGHGGYRQVQTPKGKLFAFEPEGQHVVTCAPNGAQIYKMGSEGVVQRSLFLGGHRTPVVAVDWSPVPEYRMCVAGSMDGRLRVSTLLAQ